MKATPDYKALYHQCTGESAGKDHLITVLQGQVMQLAGERQTLVAIITEQHQQVSLQQAQITGQQLALEQQRQTILHQGEKLSQQQSIIAEQNTLITGQQKLLDQDKKELLHLHNLRYELAQLKKWVYGIKSEKRHHIGGEDKEANADQLSLPLDVDSWGVCSVSSRRNIQQHLRVIKTTEAKKCGGRHDFPEGLEEEITILEPADKPQGARCVGYVDQRQLACEPMRWYIKVTRRPMYLAPKDEARLYFKQLIAPLPPHPIEKCKVDVSVLVLLTVDKFLYHLPLWRRHGRLRHLGIELPYSSLCSLVNKTCAALEPLWHLLLKEITQSGLLHIDETRYRVLDDTKKKGKKSHIGWMWACLNPLQRIVCFLYQRGRGKKDIRSVLQGYKGYLMSDAYGAYTQYGKQPGVIHQHCLSHARRYFLYSLDQDAARASALDQFFGPLYGIEQECRLLELDYDAITEKRRLEAVPILEALRKWLERELPKTTPRTPIYKAIAYTLHNFSALVQYTEEGMLSIDNNILEGQIRSIALGRLNHLFAGSHRAGELAAIMYSFMATCKLQGIDAARWLDDVLRRIPGHPEDKLLELLPQLWKPLNAEKTKSA